MTHHRMKHRSAAITYPWPIEFDTFDAFLEEVESALCSVENADIAAVYPIAFLKSLASLEEPAGNLRWLADLIDKNLERFEHEIAARNSTFDEVA